MQITTRKRRKSLKLETLDEPLTSMSQLAHFKSWLKTASSLTDKDCELFEPHLKCESIKNKDLILSEGEVCNEIRFVISGVFRMYYLSEGKEINSHFFFENSFAVDYNSFLSQKPNYYYIQAIEDAEVITFSFETLQNAYNISHRWERFGRVMAEIAYKTAMRRVESFLFMDGEQRYISLLENEPHVLEKVPLYHIASYLGLERESLSRLRKKITDKSRK